MFPDNDEPWWLTDVSRRAPAEEQDPGDEDGPASEVAEEGQQAEVSDDDPVSSGAGATPIRLGSGGACKLFCFVCVFRLETLQNVAYCCRRRSL